MPKSLLVVGPDAYCLGAGVAMEDCVDPATTIPVGAVRVSTTNSARAVNDRPADRATGCTRSGVSPSGRGPVVGSWAPAAHGYARGLQPRRRRRVHDARARGGASLLSVGASRRPGGTPPSTFSLPPSDLLGCSRPAWIQLGHDQDQVSPARTRVRMNGVRQARLLSSPTRRGCDRRRASPAAIQGAIRAERLPGKETFTDLYDGQQRPICSSWRGPGCAATAPIGACPVATFTQVEADALRAGHQRL